MDFETKLVLGLTLLASLVLLAYVYVVLPSQLEGRIRESMRAFSLAVELRFPSHRGITAVVVERSLQVGEALNLSRRRLLNLETAAELRDIGMCSMPYQLINRQPVREWTEADKAAYDRHPEVSAAMLELIPSLKHLSEIVRSHHVHFDGSSGGLFASGVNLPIESRILKVVTDYTWLEMTEGQATARDKMCALSGGSFDPAVVEAFLRVLTSESVGEFRGAAVKV